MRHHPVEMVFGEYLVCVSVVLLLSHKAWVVGLALVWAPGKVMYLPL